MFSKKHTLFILTILFLSVSSVFAAKFNAYGLNFYTVETSHFRINYQKGCEQLVNEVSDKFEQLYDIYRNTYGMVLPGKTEVVIIDGDESNGWAFSNLNTITIWTHDFDFNLRGSHDWFEDVITHEYAHIVSIWSSLKLSPKILDMRIGFFSHPNESNRIESFHSIPTDILPPWFTEGIAQYESSRNGTDTWDSHRDMILRSLTLSGKLLSWDHMQVFAGKGDDFEKTYNQGFSLVTYIAETYGYDKIVSLLRESSKMARFDFDKSIKQVLGISAKKLYNNWKQSLLKRYKGQIDTIGVQVYGKKINKNGYVNVLPRFSPNGSKIYFQSNGKSDYGRKQLYMAPVSDTADTSKFDKPVKFLGNYYDINGPTGKICFISAKSRKSVLPAKQGGVPVFDLFIDTLPSGKKEFKLFRKKTERQITERKAIFSASFSPDGKKLVCVQRNVNRFHLAIVDTSGKQYSVIYPDSGASPLFFIYSVDWSPDGRHIAFSYFDKHDRNIGIYDTLSRTCEVLFDTGDDERDPSYSPDGKYLYFSSDRTGIFNIYRYDIGQKKVEQLTNVSGSAFQPAVSPDGSKLVYSGYDMDGYGIYLLDSIPPLGTITADTLLHKRNILPPSPPSIAVSTPRPYQHFPRQLLISPVLIAEQLVTKENNRQQGETTLKAGFVFNLLDPLTLSNLGSELGGYLFLEPKHLFDFFQTDLGAINTRANFDVGLFGVTQLLPLTLSFNYSLRGIAGEDQFFNETEETVDTLPYNLQLQDLNLLFTHNINKDALAVSLLLGLNRYDVNLLLEELYDLGVFKYNMNKGYRAGLLSTLYTPVIDSRMNISPKGIAAKIQYDFWNQSSLKEENSFDPESNTPKEMYDKYLFHQVMGHAKIGIPAPWYGKHDIHLDMQGTYLQVLKEDTKFPSFFLPGAWVPGYSYYYRDEKISKNDTTLIQYDTLLVTGKAVLNGEFSYRFPLWRGLIDKKIWFIYLERLYGAINISGGAGWDNPSDFFKFNREDWLTSFGLELRLEALTFSSYPLAIKLRWDRGLDKGPPLGGNRFSFALGYDFDNWAMILEPDYVRKYR